MQDKDIDRLFRSELQDLEVKPSHAVWDEISQKLDGDKGKQRWLPYLSIAASMLVVLGMGLYFIPQVKTGEQKPNQIVAVKSHQPVEAITKTAANEPLQEIALTAQKRTFIKTKTKKLNQLQAPLKSIEPSATPVMAAIIEKMPEQTLQVDQRDAGIIKPVVPGTETRLTAQADISDETPAVIQQPLLIKQSSQNTKVLAANAPKKHRINSLGDLINAVVSKVDKRKDKLIEFSGTDDDESTISGVNLGFVKIKKQD